MTGKFFAQLLCKSCRFLLFYFILFYFILLQVDEPLNGRPLPAERTALSARNLFSCISRDIDSEGVSWFTYASLHYISILMFQLNIRCSTDIFDNKHTFGWRLAPDDAWMSSVVTASSPLVIRHDSRQAVAAVVGLKMKYSTFYEHFVNATMSCGLTLSGDNCNFTCRSPVS